MATSTSRLNRVSARQVREALTFAEGDVIAFRERRKADVPHGVRAAPHEIARRRSRPDPAELVGRCPSSAGRAGPSRPAPGARGPIRPPRRMAAVGASATRMTSGCRGEPARGLRQGVAQPGRDRALPVLGHDEGPTASEPAPTEYARDVERDWTGRLRGNGGPPRHSECRQGVSLTCRRAPYQSAASRARNSRAPRPGRRRDRRAALPRCATRRGCSSAPGDVETDGTMTSSSPSAARSRTRPAHGLTFAGRPLRGRDPPSARRSGAGTPRPRRRFQRRPGDPRFAASCATADLEGRVPFSCRC